MLLNLELSYTQLRQAEPKNTIILEQANPRCLRCGIKIGPTHIENSVNSNGICGGCEAWELKRRRN